MKKIWDFIKSFLTSLVIVIIIVKFIAMPCVVSGSSMYPTLEDGQYGFSSIISVKLGNINRFDLVVVQNNKDKLVKRVIGLPGETISCKNDTIYINGLPIDEDFLDTEYRNEYNVFTYDFDEITVEDGYYFLLGDNRPKSADSRIYGLFAKDEILSKGFFCIFPFRNIGNKK